MQGFVVGLSLGFIFDVLGLGMLSAVWSWLHVHSV